MHQVSYTGIAKHVPVTLYSFASAAGPSEAQVELEQHLTAKRISDQDSLASMQISKDLVTDSGSLHFKQITSWDLRSFSIETDANGSNVTTNHKNENCISTTANALEKLKYESSGTQAYTERTDEDLLSLSAHRPTTLNFTSANENEFQTNDSCACRKDNELVYKDNRNIDSSTLIVHNNDVEVDEQTNTTSNQASGIDFAEQTLRTQVGSGAIPRSERSARPSGRSAAVLKVKVEKRPTANHSTKERSSSLKESVQSVPPYSTLQHSKSQNSSIEDEVFDLMAEVKEVTDQIKKEVRQLRESETPTPETPTPLREFREFVCKEEEQDSERLPTIAETIKETEEEGLTNGIPGEMDCNLTLSNHTSTISISADKDKHNLNGCSVIPQSKKSKSLFKDAVTKVRQKLNENVFDPVVRSYVTKRVVNVEALSLTPSSISCKLNQHSHNKTPYTNTCSESKQWDISSIVLNTHLFLNSNRCCNYCNKDFLLNDVCNDLGNIISFVEEGIKLSKFIDVENIISSLDVLKYKVGGIVGNSLANTKFDQGSSSSVDKDFIKHNSGKSTEVALKNSEGEFLDITCSRESEIISSNTQKMPFGNETSLIKHQLSSNLIEEAGDQDNATDEEEVKSDTESNLVLPKTVAEILGNSVDESESKATDSESIEVSGDELDEFKEKITLQTFLLDSCQESVNLTEGYTRELSPHLSPSEDLSERHLKSMKLTNQANQSIDLQDISQNSTDEENMGDLEIDLDHYKEDEAPNACLPEHYESQCDSISSYEVVKPPTSQANNEFGPKKRTRNKQNLQVLIERERTTDVEDLFEESTNTHKNLKCRRKKAKQKKYKKPSLNLATAKFECEVSETEILSNSSDASSSENMDDFNENLLVVLTEKLTDSEEVNDSALEDEDLIASPIPKSEISFVPEPCFEKIFINDQENLEKTNVVDTDEEGFSIDDHDDDKPFVCTPLKFDVTPLGKEHLSDSGEDDEDVLTDIEDIKIQDGDEENIINTAIQTMENEDLTILLNMHMQSDSSAHIMSKKVNEYDRISVNTYEEGALTDVEEYDEEGEFIQPSQISTFEKTDETDSDNIEDSDGESKAHQSRFKAISKKLKKLPLVSQLSDVKFVETEHGSLSIIIAPNSDKKSAVSIEDDVKGVIFTETNEDDYFTDIEDISSSENLKISFHDPVEQLQEPNTDTDTEDFDRPDSGFDRPVTPMPPEVFYFPNTNEKISIVEDKYGVPHVQIEETEASYDTIEENSQELTDTEDISIHEHEIDSMTDPINSSPHDDSGILLEELSVVSTKYKNKKVHKDRLPEEGEGVNTDVEDISCCRRKRKPKSKKSLDALAKMSTDVEITPPYANPLVLDFNEMQSVVSEQNTEPVESSVRKHDSFHDKNISQEIIHDLAIKRVIIHKENQEGNYVTEFNEENEATSFPVAEDALGTTDIERVDISDADEVDEGFLQNLRPGTATLPDSEESTISVSVKAFSSRRRKTDEAEIKENLLLPEGRHTDVESLDEGEEIGESRTAPKEASKAEASKTSSIMESDLAVLESIVTTKEAEIREMSFSKTLAESQAQTQADKGDQEAQAQADDGGQGFVTARPDTSKAKPDLTIKLKPNTTETKPDLPIKLKPKIQSSPPPPPPRTWPVTESDVKIPDAKATTTTEVELSSDDDQLAIMKDSPRWEEEEIQAEDTADIRPIKVELKLMVKTTETGKESIEIRSIREFVDHNEEKPPDIHDGAEIPKNQLSSALQDSGKEEKVPITQHRISNDRCSTSPKFVRPKEKFPFFDEGTDDFNLMSQVRDIIAETEKERDISTHEDPPTKKKRSQKETNKQQKKP